MKIAVIGIGSVGGSLARRWSALGHDIVLGVRETPHAKADALAEECEGEVLVTTPAEAAQQAEVVVLALPWNATQAVVESLGDLGERVVIDCTNPWVYGEGLQVGYESSGGEKVAEWARGGRVTKALNQTGYENMIDPKFGEHRAAMFVAGDDDGARSVTASLVAELGFEAIEVGGLETSRLLEPHAVLWIELALMHGQGRNLAWGLLRR